MFPDDKTTTADFRISFKVMNGYHHILELLPRRSFDRHSGSDIDGVGVDYHIAGNGVALEMRMGRTVTAADFAEHLKRVAADVRVPHPFSGLWDGSAVDVFLVESADMRCLSRIMLRPDSKFVGSRIAVAAPNLLVFGMSRVLQALTEPGAVHFEVFRDVDTAREWLRRD